LDPTIISVNRIGKEDTFLMLFFMLATCCYERAKIVWPADRAAANRLYNAPVPASGSCSRRNTCRTCSDCTGCSISRLCMTRAGNAPRLRQYLGTMLATFLVADFAILLPDAWAYVGRYVSGDISRITGTSTTVSCT
jgi:hypothetical protein